MYKTGDVVRHQGMAEWGLGKVQALTGDGKVVIKFAGRPGDVMLTASGASTHLTRDDSEWQDGPRAKGRRTAKAKVVKKMPCITCAKELTAVVRLRQGRLEGVPRVLGPERPAARAAPVPDCLRGADTNGVVARGDSAHAGWCLSCRSNGAVVLGEPKLCSDFSR